MSQKESTDEFIVVDAKRYNKVKKALEEKMAGSKGAPPSVDEKETTRELVVVDVKRYKRIKKALEASEERYRQLFENVPIGIYRTTPDGRFIDANPALIKMLGFTTFAQVAALDVNKEYAKSKTSRSEFICRLETEGEIKGLETVWIRSDGTEVHVRENAKLVRGENGEVFFEGTLEDITLSKLANEAQKIRTQQIEILNCIITKGNLATSIGDMLEVILDCMFQPLAFDDAAIFMYDPEATKVKLLAHRGPANQFALDEKYMSIDSMPFSQVLQRGQPVFLDDAQKNNPHFFSQWGWHMACSVPLLSKGRVIGALAVASCHRTAFTPEEKDILEMIGKEAGTLVSKLLTETALRESEKYYRTLIDTSPDIILAMDLDAKLITVNQQFLKVGKYLYDDVLGKSTYDFVSGLDRILLEKRTAQFIKSKKVSGSEYEFKNKDGRAIPLEVSASLLYDEAGQPMGIIAIGRDITQRKQAEEALRQSEEKFRSITEQTGDLIAITDAEGVITYASTSARALFQLEPEEMQGCNFAEFLDAPSIPKAMAAFRDDLERSGRSVGLELTMKRKDGSLFAGELNGSSFQYGDQFGSLVVIRDISERKLAEDQLRLSEETFRSTFHAIPAPAYLWTRQADGSTRLTQYNLAAEEITRGGIKEYLGITPETLFADNPGFAKTIALAMTNGQNFSEEVKYHYQSIDESKWLVVDYVQTSADNVLVITRDVSERKRNEQELLESKALLDAVIDNVPLMIFLKEAKDLRFVIFNRAGENLLGHNRMNLLGKNNLDLFPPEQASFFMAKDREALDGDADLLDIPEEPIMTANKGLRLLHTRKVCIRGDDGVTKYLLGISEDITERKEAEAKLLAYQEQLRALTSEMFLIEEKERRRIASELHDQIGQNLALCKLKVAAMEKGMSHSQVKSELSTVRRLLECSIQDARSLIFDLSPPVLYELGFQAALEWLAERIEAQYHVPVEFENRAAEGGLGIDLQVILFQVVRELLVNVGKHSRASQAKVILSQEDHFLKIQVNDDGVGFDASQIYDVKGHPGSFGFFSMRERLNYLGGGMDVRSRPGQGSQIVLTVPRKVAAKGEKP